MPDAYMVVVEDTVVQLTEYVVFADSADDAAEKIANGVFAMESESETVDTLRSEVKGVEHITGNIVDDEEKEETSDGE